MRVRTITPHVYADKPRNVGDEYEMENQFVEIMTLAKNVMVVEQQRDVKPTEPRKYRRRDMKAE